MAGTKPINGGPAPADLKRIFEVASEGVVAVDQTGRVLWLNPAAARLTGASPDAPGTALTDLLGVEVNLAQTEEQSICIRRMDGSEGALALLCRPGEGGTPSLLFLRDIGPLQEVSAQAARTGSILATAQRLARLATWEWDVVKDRVILSEELYTLFGNGGRVYSLADFSDRVFGDDRQRVREALDRAVAGIEPYNVVFRLIAPGKGLRVVRAMADTHVEGGRVVRLSGAVQDITDQRALESRLAVADRMVSVGTLASGVAHEINNPLAYVVANTSFAVEAVRRQAETTDSPALDEALEALASIKEGAERIRIIVRDLKTFSRPSDGKGGPLDVRRAIESALTMAANEIRHRARLVLEYGEVPLVDADESRLGHLLLNLLINAAHATPEGALDDHEIRVRTRVKDGRVAIEVEDTGSGIAPEVLPRIFDPFFTTKPVGVGTGLGLAVCHGIAKSLGGDIEVDSVVGKGSTFRLMLPPVRATTPVEKPPPPVAPAAKGRIYVIDDEPALTAAVRRALALRHDVATFNYGGEALGKLGTGDPCDVILCDLMMPRMTGMDFYEELRKIRPELADRVVFLTGGAFTPRAREFLENVDNPRLEKPFDLTALSNVVGTVLRTPLGSA